jgi:hypothetical protein
VRGNAENADADCFYIGSTQVFIRDLPQISGERYLKIK